MLSILRDLLIIVVGVTVFIMFYYLWKLILIERKTKSIEDYPNELKPIMDDFNWYYNNCIVNHEITEETATTFDNVSEFYVKTFNHLNKANQVKYFSLLFTYQDNIHEYVDQIKDDVQGTGVTKPDQWYDTLSDMFIQVYQKTLQIAYPDQYAERKEEFNTLDFATYRVAINKLNLWETKDNFKVKQKLSN